MDKILQSLSKKGDQTAALDCLDSEGYAAIHYVVLRGHRRKRELLEGLVIAGADVNFTTGGRRELTPLHLAVEVRRSDLVLCRHYPLSKTGQNATPTNCTYK